MGNVGNVGNVGKVAQHHSNQTTNAQTKYYLLV